MVGCCSHHSHGCEGDLSGPIDDLATHGGHCSHATRDGEHSNSGCDHSHHGTSDCQGATCSFLSSSRTVADSFAPTVEAPLAALLNDQPSLARFSPEQCPLSSGRLLLPVRLHLVDQVLLI